MKTVPSDSVMPQAFRKRVWRFGVKFPHQGTRECARRVRQGKGA